MVEENKNADKQDGRTDLTAYNEFYICVYASAHKK